MPDDWGRIHRIVRYVFGTLDRTCGWRVTKSARAITLQTSDCIKFSGTSVYSYDCQSLVDKTRVYGSDNKLSDAVVKCAKKINDCKFVKSNTIILDVNHPQLFIYSRGCIEDKQ